MFRALKKHGSLIELSVSVMPYVSLLLSVLLIGDHELFLLINRGVANPALDFACVYASPILFSAFYVLTLITLFSSGDTTSAAIGAISLATGPLSYGIGSLAKFLVMRPRPFDVLPAVRVIGLLHTSSFSFPSTTTMLAFGFAFPILFEKGRFGAILLILSYFMGFSVIYTGYHFPWDVLAGIMLSLVIAICTNRMKKPLAKFLKMREYKSFDHTG